MTYTLPIVLIVLAVIILWLVAVFNKLVTLRNRVHEAWSDIEVQLKRRYDLIPNLVNTVKGYASHEDSVFTKVTDARTKAMSAQTPAEHAQSENMLTGALKSLFAVAENYPSLQASQNFLSLQNDLTDTEDKIQASRRFYNGQVRNLNTSLQVFPNNLIAGPFGFKKETFFDAPDSVNETPKVSF
jgi:LemA protein